MSETQEGYGAQSTPDMGESYPPQTGDLLGAYVARLARTVLELDAERKAKSAEPSAYQKSLEARIERLEKATKPDFWERLSASDRTVVRVEEKRIADSMKAEPTAEPAYTETRDDQSRVTELEAPAVTTPIVTRERTHGRYGTRNLTKTKSIPSGEHRGDFFASDPGDVCARCGHMSASHNATWDIDTDSTKSWCNKKGCTCAGYISEPEPTAEPVCAACGHEWRDHSDTGGICMGGVMGKPCSCKEYKPVASEG